MKTTSHFVTALLASLLVTSPALASGDGQLSIWFIAAHAFNLAILLFLLVKFAGKPIQRALASRADAVTQEIDVAAKAHSEAQALLDIYEKKLAGLDAEVASIIDQFTREGEAEKARLIEQGEIEAARIRSEAERSVKNEIARARARLEDEVIDRAIESASAAIKEKMTSADHRRLTVEYLSQVEKFGNA